MRPRFTDVQRIKREAKKAIEDGTLDVRRWWSNKYNRPANDRLFQNRPISVWVREMYEDAYERKFDLETLLEDPEMRQEERRHVSQKLRRIYKALGEEDLTLGEDPLIDKWERELAEGKEPDLDEQL